MTSPGAVAKFVQAVVDSDGNAVISSSQLPKLSPGMHLQVQIYVGQMNGTSLRGLLPDLPDLTWEDFEEASMAARTDAEASVERQ